MKTRLRARYVVGHDGKDHVVHLDGEVVYEGERIVYVGRSYDGPVDVDIDEGLALIGPGFIDLNALGDIDHAVFDTYQDAGLGRGLVWSEDYLTRRRTVFGREDAAFNRHYAFGQLLLNGITTALPIASEVYQGWAETHDQLADAAQVAAELGLRVYLGPSYRSSVPAMSAAGEPFLHAEPELGRDGLDTAIRFARDFDGSHRGLVRGMLAPSRIENHPVDELRRTKAASDELGCPVRLHAGQTLTEVGVLESAYGKRPIELLDEIGFLGPQTLIPHAWAVSGHSQIPATGSRDLDALRDSGSTVVFCPMAVARYAVVLESFDRYLHHGIRMGMGTDTAPPDMIRALDTGMVLTKAVERTKWSGSVADLYRAATTGGADALGRPDLGRLTAGAQADLAVFDLSNPRFGPVDDPIRSLVLMGNGRDTRRVVVAGRTVVEDGSLPGVDHAAERERAQEYLATYRASYSERDYLHRSERELFPPSFRMESS